MYQPEKIFSNPFDNPRVTPLRLYNFSSDSVARLINGDTDGFFKITLANIVVAQTPFHTGISGIDTSIGVKKGNTIELKVSRKGFGVYMSDRESEVARIFGGRSSPIYTSFYPKGIMEYTTATKTKMPLLVKRINTLATDNATQLGSLITGEMQAFMVQWQTISQAQSTLNNTLSDGRADRSVLRHNLEMALLTTMHLVAAQYPNDPAKCSSFFDFNLLVGVKRKAAVVVVVPTALVV